MKIRVFEAFAGYGSQMMALKRLGEEFEGFEVECVGISEIDKYAIQAYNAVHGETRNFGDISKIDWGEVPDFDLFTYSFPCQDISKAGNQKGFAEGSGTRSGLLWECKKAIEAKRPKYLLLENVKALVSKKFRADFEKWLSYLEDLGYSNFWQVLNAKDYTVPQNRERVFVISIFGNDKFMFPQSFLLKKDLDTILEHDVEKSFYLKDGQIEIDDLSGDMQFVKYTRDGKGDVIKRRLSYISNTIHTSTGGGGSTDCFVFEPKIRQIMNILPEKKYKNPMCGRIYSPYGISPTLTTMQGGNREPKVLTKDYRIRKLTPRECFRLMGVSDTDIDKIQAAGISNSQQYKPAGNSIVVDCLHYIFRNLFVEEYNPSKTTLF